MMIPRGSSQRKGGLVEIVSAPSSSSSPLSVLVDDEDDDVDGSSSSLPCCMVCHQNTSRYVCPKCQVPYCSLLCYKNHGQSCTEAFYQKKVNQVLVLESKDRKDQTMSMLNRFHKKNENDDMDDDDEATQQEEELWRLMEALENANEDEANLESLLSPSMRERFRRTVESGELADLVLHPWHPWWMPDYYNGLDDGKNQDRKRTGDPASSLLLLSSLDERLLRVKPFSRIHKAPSKLLEFNLLEILCCVVATLRCFHGVDNAKRLSSFDATCHLLSHSAVLNKDARFTSVPEALMSVFASSSSSSMLSMRQHRHSPSLLILNDVERLWSCRRHVCHALLDAVDIVKAAEKQQKKTATKQQPQPQQDDKKQSLRRVRKKLEFYLSWSREAPVVASPEIGVLLQEWNDQDYPTSTR